MISILTIYELGLRKISSPHRIMIKLSCKEETYEKFQRLPPRKCAFGKRDPEKGSDGAGSRIRELCRGIDEENRRGLQRQEQQRNVEKYPQFQTAIDQLHDSSADYVGALLSVFPEARATVESEIESMLNGKEDVDAAVKNMADSINKSIEEYNLVNE